MAALGIRGKSLLALLLTFLLAIGVTVLVGREALQGVQNRFGEAYARNVVQLNRERLFAPVTRELALAQRLAESQITRAWLLAISGLSVTTPTSPHRQPPIATTPTATSNLPARRPAMR